jgi:hypothetical protein
LPPIGGPPTNSTPPQETREKAETRIKRIFRIDFMFMEFGIVDVRVLG